MKILLYYLEYDRRVHALRVFSLSFGKFKAFFSNELIVVKCVLWNNVRHLQWANKYRAAIICRVGRKVLILHNS